MLRSLLLTAGLALLLASGCNSSKTVAAPAPPTSDTSTAAAPPAKVHGSKRGGQAAQRMTEMIARLSLDDAQAAKFREITQRNARQGRDLRQNAGNDRRAARTAGRKMREKMQMEMNALLTKEQQAVYVTIKAEQQ